MSSGQRTCPKCGERFRVDVKTCPFDQSLLVEPADPLIGRTIAGRYQVQERLGSGGMGNVYRARHGVIGRHVALKFLSPDLARLERPRKRFLREARATNQIRHEHIIQVTDFGETDDGHVYLVMDYLEGGTLAEAIQQGGPLEVERALRITLQVAEGLAQAHELNVVHRDIKPANIFLAKQGDEVDFVKLCDFGLAHVEEETRITVKGHSVGTPAYIAPEQITSSDVVAASDLYALGCVLFEMLTGRVPFEGLPTSMMVQHLNENPPRPSNLCEWIPRDLDRLVLKLLQKKAALRHRDAYHLTEDLELALQTVAAGAGQARRSSIPVPPAAGVTGPAERWLSRVRAYERLMRSEYPAGAPDQVQQDVRHMQTLVVELQRARESLSQVAQEATQHEQETHSPLVRIGYALDELARDASRVAREMDAIRSQLDRAQAAMAEAVRAVSQDVGSTPPPPMPGHTLSDKEAARLHALMRSANDLAETRAGAGALEQRLMNKRQEWEDLRMQIDALKQRMGSLAEASSTEIEVSHEEARRLDALAQQKLDAIAEVNDRLAGHFQQRSRPAALKPTQS